MFSVGVMFSLWGTLLWRERIGELLFLPSIIERAERGVRDTMAKTAI
jgi:hypothetical protein